MSATCGNVPAVGLPATGARLGRGRRTPFALGRLPPNAMGLSLDARGLATRFHVLLGRTVEEVTSLPGAPYLSHPLR